jgi:hypothetical protein
VTAGHLGIDAGQQVRSDLEDLLARAAAQCPQIDLACTHVVDALEPHWAGSLRVTTRLDISTLADVLGPAVTIVDGNGESGGPARWRAGARDAMTQLVQRRAGRAVLFPGQDRLVGDLAAEEVAALSAIDRLVGLAGTPTSGVRLATRDFVRPEFVDGELILRVRPYDSDDAVAPFEVPRPTPCCALHA